MSLESDARQWQDEGWVVVPDVVPTEEIDAAVEELWTLYPRPEEFEDPDNARRKKFLAGKPRKWPAPNVADSDAAFREEQFDGHIKFPFATGGKLNRLLLHPRLVEFAQLALGDDDIRLYQAGLWAKYAGATNYEQPLHIDRNHSVVPARMDPGWWHMEGFLYLSDVDEHSGPTELLSPIDSPKPDPNAPLMRHEAPEIHSKLSKATGRRGSFLAYRPDVWHRGASLTGPSASRFIMIACFKLAGQEWVGFDALSDFVDNWHFLQMAASCTPKELALFGVPKPGHAYWTPAMIDALAARYPGLDVEPWRNA